MKVNKSHIGHIFYPLDNSWSIELKSGEEALLTKTGHPVKIVSEPYQETIKLDGFEWEREFVNVEYDKKVYRVMNGFSRTKFF